MNKRGFTIIELMIAMLTGLVILIAAYAAVDVGQSNAVHVGRKVMTQQDARIVLDYMSMDIRMASFNPGHTANIWADINGNSINPDDGNCGIQVANANQLFVEMDLNANGRIAVGTVADPNEVVSYTYDGVNAITRTTSFKGLPQPMLGGVDTGTIVDNAAAGVPLFQYFNRNGNPAATIADIRRVRITLVIRTEQPSNVNQPVQMTYYTDVLLINHPLSTYVFR